jgi:arylsulfatase A-like enzyme
VTRRTGVRPLILGIAVLLVASAAVVVWRAQRSDRAPRAGQDRPNIVLILTDDQRADSMFAMPIVKELLGDHGVTFENGFVVNSLCCPSRASILTGQYSHTTGVWSNRPPYGGFVAFDDSVTIATQLQGAGYTTGHVGKYLNGYYGTYEPPGWDRWFAFSGTAPYRQRELYYDYFVNEDGTMRFVGHDPADYSTDVMGGQAAAFIRDADPASPLFLQFATSAPHIPGTPAVQDRGAFDDLPPWNPPGYNEDDVSDKPAWVRSLPKLRPNVIPTVRRRQLQSLLPVDRQVRRVVDALRETGRLENTMIVFTSDNGYGWGEHRWHNKQTPYEHDIRVPMIVRYDHLVKDPRTEAGFALNIDLAPTFADLGGVSLPKPDGRSLLPLLGDGDPPWRSDFLVEHGLIEGVLAVPSYCGIRSERFAYVRYITGEEELYDLPKDPGEETNVASNPAYAADLQHQRERLRRLCDPPPPDAPPGFPP